ncbi:MAG TPA: hypothetical protein VEU07_04910, partial [Candidatus Acidoferrum sp.]|nr:hypothetical protein [Candidatus Acidoferrum sp.]
MSLLAQRITRFSEADLLFTSLALLASLAGCAHPLLEAAGRGDTKTVLSMLDQGENVNLKD